MAAELILSLSPSLSLVTIAVSPTLSRILLSLSPAGSAAAQLLPAELGDLALEED